MYKPEDLEIGHLENDETHGAFLPHSCDEWEIGGPEQIRALISDLQRALAVLESPTRVPHDPRTAVRNDPE